MTSRPTADGMRRPAAADERPARAVGCDGEGLGLRCAGGRRWPNLGLAVILGLVAGSTLFATRAQGRDAAPRRPVRRG